MEFIQLTFASVNNLQLEHNNPLTKHEWRVLFITLCSFLLINFYNRIRVNIHIIHLLFLQQGNFQIMLLLFYFLWLE